MKHELNTSVLIAIENAGGPSALARKLSALHPKGAGTITPQAVSIWRKKGQVPPMRVLAVEKVTNVSRHDLRPDVYPRKGK